MSVSAIAYVPATGQITGFIQGTAANIAANVTATRGLFIAGPVDPDQYYIASGPLRVEARPIVIPPATAQAAGWAYDMTGLPSSSVVTVGNEAGDEMMISDLSEPLTLVDAGLYRLQVKPPFPWLGFDIDVEVGNA